MACLQPATGALTSTFYVAEIDCGVTPVNPAWLPFRYTSGNMQLTKDFITSEELDGSRDVADARGGSKQTSGDISVEASYGSYDDIFEAALGGTWQAGGTGSGLDITVDDVAKTFTRAAGDFTTDVYVGRLIRFPDLTGDNAKAFYVTAVTATVVTCANAEGLTSENVTSDFAVSDVLTVGSLRRTFSVLTHFQDADGGAGEYHITKGVEISGWNFDVAVNAMVTGSFPTIGRSYHPDTTLPAGSTFPLVDKTEPYAGVDGRILEDDLTLGFITSATSNLDNNASAQFEIGSNDVSFISRGRANSTLSLASYFTNSVQLEKFVNETEVSVVITLEGDDGALSFTYPRVKYTSGAPDVAGEGEITQTLDGQALAGTGVDTGVASCNIQRLPV